MKGLEHLLQPIKVKNLTIPNRVVLPPMGTVLTNPDGSVGERLLAFFERRVKSGAGFVINEIDLLQIGEHADTASQSQKPRL